MILTIELDNCLIRVDIQRKFVIFISKWSGETVRLSIPAFLKILRQVAVDKAEPV